MTERGSWQNVSSRQPCQVCGSPDWCGRSADGQYALCRRHGPPGARPKADRHGVPYYVVKLQDGPPVPLPEAQKVETDPELADRAYRALLACPAVRLSPAHARALQARGMTSKTAARHSLRSLPANWGSRLAIVRDVARAVGKENFSRIPGFLLDEEGRPRIHAHPGLLIPVFEFSTGRLVAMRLRMDVAPADRKRYRWLSSAPKGAGCRPSCFVAFPAGQAGPWPSARLIEGELKAMIAAQYTGLLTVSTPGVALWHLTADVFKQLGVSQVRIAFDNDWRTNPAVHKALADADRALEAQGFQVSLETWPEEFKGLDDYLAHAHANRTEK